MAMIEDPGTSAYYFFRGYVYVYDFGEEFSECAVTVTAEWIPIPVDGITSGGRPKIRVVDHYIIVYSGLNDHAGYIENSGMGILRLQITNHCQCDITDCINIAVVISPVIVEDVMSGTCQFPRDLGFLHFARIETCSCQCISWILNYSGTEGVPEVTAMYNHAMIASGIDVLDGNGGHRFIEYSPGSELILTAVQSQGCLQLDGGKK